MKRKLKDLSRREMKIIAEDYAYTSQTKSGEHFADKYGISETTFYNVLRKTISESIVSEKVAQMIARKAADNTKRHGGDGAEIRTLAMYNQLIRDRKRCRLGREEAKKWTRRYINSDLFLETFARRNYIDVLLLKRALHDAIVYSWITEEEVMKLKEKTKIQKTEDIEEAFGRLLEKRSNYKKAKKK